MEELEQQIDAWHRSNEKSQKLAQIPGIGPLTATALVASIGDARCFNNGRELAAWLGLVPRQHSSGGKVLLQGISKRGDAYLRTLMVHGARSVIRVAERKTTSTDRWSTKMLARRHKKRRSGGSSEQERQGCLGAVGARTGLQRELRNDALKNGTHQSNRKRTTSARDTPRIAQAIINVMARQVRPWQVKPISHRERKARQAVKAPASEFHQGQGL